MQRACAKYSASNSSIKKANEYIVRTMQLTEYRPNVSHYLHAHAMQCNKLKFNRFRYLFVNPFEHNPDELCGFVPLIIHLDNTSKNRY